MKKKMSHEAASGMASYNGPEKFDLAQKTGIRSAPILNSHHHPNSLPEVDRVCGRGLNSYEDREICSWVKPVGSVQWRPLCFLINRRISDSDSSRSHNPTSAIAPTRK